MISRILGALSLLLLLIHPYCSSQWLDDSVSERRVQKGIEQIYNMSFDSARAEFNAVIRQNPTNPAGHFFLAMVEWWNIMLDLDDESHDAKFIAMLEKVVDICDKRLDKNDDDIEALFFKGGSIGFRGRLYANRGDWIKAANDGRNAMPIVQQMYKLAPNNYDILLGIGIYNYYAAVVPEQYPVVKPLMIFFPKGDKLQGVTQLQQAAAHAKYANYEASYFLLQLYLNYEKRFSDALVTAESLHKRFPNNPVLYSNLGKANVSLGNWEEFHRIYADVLDRVKKNEFGYNRAAEREAQYYMGLWEMNKAAYDVALQHFYRCDELSRTLDAKTASGFMAMANLKIGMVYDRQSRRDMAIEQYKKVLQFGDYQDSHKLAEQYLITPFGH